MKSDDTSAVADLSAKQHKREKALFDLRRAEQGLKNLELRAPAAGMVNVLVMCGTSRTCDIEESTFRALSADILTKTSYFPITPFTSTTSGKTLIFAITSFSRPGMHVAKMYANMSYQRKFTNKKAYLVVILFDRKIVLRKPRVKINTVIGPNSGITVVPNICS